MPGTVTAGIRTRSRRVRNVLLWIGVGFIALIGLIVFVASIGSTPKGQAIIENPGTLIGIVITTLGGIFTAILPVIIRSESNTEQIKENVQNSHVKPMRDDMDDKHNEVLRRIADVQGTVTHAIDLTMNSAGDIRGLRKDIGRLTERQNAGFDRLRGVEERQKDVIIRLSKLEERDTS